MPDKSEDEENDSGLWYLNENVTEHDVIDDKCDSSDSSDSEFVDTCSEADSKSDYD